MLVGLGLGSTLVRTPRGFPWVENWLYFFRQSKALMRHIVRGQTIRGIVSSTTQDAVDSRAPLDNVPIVFGRRFRVDFGLARYRALAVFLVLVALELLVFRSYFIGRIAPPWDFFGPYNTEAYQWWELGGFFAPREWVSNAWAGYPSALNLQNSAWYLPVGLVSAFGPFTLHASAVLAALHVAFGAAGTYLLVRSFKVRFSIAMLALVAGFFAVGHYSNAEHLDISRAYAWVPWLLLVVSPTFPWQRTWSIPAAAIVMWQAVTGMYPGMAIAFVYIGAFWVISYQVLTRFSVRKFLLPLAISALIALLLSMPRLLPYAMLKEDVASGLPESSSFNFEMLATLVFGYSSDEIIGHLTMRALFVPATMVLLAFFASWGHRITRLALALLLPAIVLGLPVWPWAEAAQKLPGLGFSRFGLSDFKVYMVLGIVLLACSGAMSIASYSAQKRLPRRMWISLVCALTFVIAMTVQGILGPYPNVERIPAFVLMVVAFAIVVLFSVSRIGLRHQQAFAVFMAALTILTAITGTVWAFTNELPWRIDRNSGEVSTFGGTVDSLIAQRVPVGETVQRSARVPMPEGATSGAALGGYSNRYSYLNQDSVIAYINLKGSVTQTLLEQSLIGPNASPEFAAFLAAPGTAVTIAPGASLAPADLLACVDGSSCGDASVTPVAYIPGHLTYKFSSPTELNAIFNEAYYQGWSAEACIDGSCQELPVSRSAQGLVSVEVPEGSYLLHLDYVVRGAAAGWLLFWGGVVAAIASSSWVFVRRRNQKLAVHNSALAETVIP